MKKLLFFSYIFSGILSATPLSDAINCIIFDDIEGVNVILDKGLDLNSIDEYGYSLLYMAIYENKPDIVKLLVERGADVNLCREETAISPLYKAVEVGNFEIVKFLLSKYVNYNFQVRGASSRLNRVLDINGWTALHMAVHMYYENLNHHGADSVEAIDSFNILNELLSYKDKSCNNIDYSIVDSRGRTARQLAGLYGLDNIIRLIDKKIIENKIRFGSNGLFHITLHNTKGYLATNEIGRDQLVGVPQEILNFL